MLIDKVDISNYIGDNIKKNSDETFILLQFYLVYKTINLVGPTLSTSLKSRETPTVKPSRHKYEYSLERKCI